MTHSKGTVGRDYIHMNVGDILLLCMEDSSVAPVQALVESLVVIGPDSLALLKEILKEASKRRQQVREDQTQVLRGLTENLTTFGLQLPDQADPDALIRMRSGRFLQIMKRQHIEDEKVQVQCMQLLQDSRDLLIGLSIKLDLLARIEEYLQDWTWGLLYLSSRHRPVKHPPLH